MYIPRCRCFSLDDMYMVGSFNVTFWYSRALLGRFDGAFVKHLDVTA